MLSGSQEEYLFSAPLLSNFFPMLIIHISVYIQAQRTGRTVSLSGLRILGIFQDSTDIDLQRLRIFCDRTDIDLQSMAEKEKADDVCTHCLFASRNGPFRLQCLARSFNLDIYDSQQYFRRASAPK